MAQKRYNKVTSSILSLSQPLHPSPKPLPSHPMPPLSTLLSFFLSVLHLPPGTGKSKLWAKNVSIACCLCQAIKACNFSQWKQAKLNQNEVMMRQNLGKMFELFSTDLPFSKQKSTPNSKIICSTSLFIFMYWPQVQIHNFSFYLSNKAYIIKVHWTFILNAFTWVVWVQWSNIQASDQNFQAHSFSDNIHIPLTAYA